MAHRCVVSNIIVFCLFYVGSSGDWVEIPQMQEEVAEKPSGGTKSYVFPRNEYVYRRPVKNNNRHIQSTYPPTTTATSPIEEMMPLTTEPTENLNIPSPYHEGPPTIQDRVDNLEEMKTEKMERKSGKLEEEVEENEDPDEPEEGTEGFMPLLKEVQEDLTVKGRKNLKGKIDRLKNLRDDLLLNIDERVTKLWGGSTKQPTEARGYKDDDHDMHFPSNEGALMTIGFLTFAVFLIKLVLKLVQAIKNKHNMMVVTPTVVTNAAIIGRKKRDVEFDEQKRILQLMDEYDSRSIKN
ncbi:uncharacterized protein LOC123674171 [Harmonia axyridis]|uniref:uncharacterized protein LOC123674171 n=1 Tax=Harmonia axyridis TaxID=115357 RepID=UPI001E278960|nr:uncharacterized protein LOC123674171 [Harmonia axyridis]